MLYQQRGHWATTFESTPTASQSARSDSPTLSLALTMKFCAIPVLLAAVSILRGKGEALDQWRSRPGLRCQQDKRVGDLWWPDKW